MKFASLPVFVLSEGSFHIMDIITSTTNPKIQYAKKLLDKKYRYEEGKYLIEGEKLVKEAVRFGKKISYAICTEKSEEFCALGLNVLTVSDRVLKSVSSLVTDQGIVAVCEMPNKQLEVPRDKCLILDSLQDPANMGAIMRTAAACGYNQIYLSNCVDPYSSKTLRSAMSAHFVLDIYQESLTTILDIVAQKCQIVCADMGGTNLFSVKVNNIHALIIGNEGNGVSSICKEKSDLVISIPMENNIESLNAAVAASVLMYQLKLGGKV